MKFIDRYLQNARINKAKEFIRRDDTVLDIGAANGVLFEKCRDIIRYGVGIDPGLGSLVQTDLYTLLPGRFPDVYPKGIRFDVITMLAVLEHLSPDIQTLLPGGCFDLLNPKGRVIITVPSIKADSLLHVLKRMRIIDGMSLEEHHGFKPEMTMKIFPHQYFKLLHRQKFQLGFNNLFVFERQAA